MIPLGGSSQEVIKEVYFKTWYTLEYVLLFVFRNEYSGSSLHVSCPTTWWLPYLQIIVTKVFGILGIPQTVAADYSWLNPLEGPHVRIPGPIVAWPPISAFLTLFAYDSLSLVSVAEETGFCTGCVVRNMR